MKGKAKLRISVAALLFVAVSAQARNTAVMLPIRDVVNMKKTKELLGEDIKLYFAAVPNNRKVEEPMGLAFARGEASPYVKGKQRSDEVTCREAMRSALAKLVQQARERGGNAIVGITSYYNKVEVGDAKEYECHAGDSRAIVELKGKVVKFAAAS